MRALKVGELDDLEVFSGCTTVRAVGLLLGQGAVFRVRVNAEGEDIVGGNNMLAVSKGKEGDGGGFLLSGLISDINGNLADAIDAGFHNRGDLPDTGFVISPAGVEEAINGFFGGSGCGEVCRINGREDRGCRGCGRIWRGIRRGRDILLSGGLHGGQGERKQRSSETEKA